MVRILRPREAVRQELDERIKLGQEISDAIEGDETLEDLRRRIRAWHSYNADLLKHRFDSKDVVEEYDPPFVGAAVVISPDVPQREPTDADRRAALKRTHDRRIETLQSLRDRLSLYDE